MKFDARIEHSPETKEAFLEWLTNESVSAFQRAAGDAERLKSAAFLYVNRARESGIAESEIAKVLGISIARSSLSQEDEDTVLGWVDRFDRLAAAVFPPPKPKRKPWWEI